MAAAKLCTSVTILSLNDIAMQSLLIVESNNLPKEAYTTPSASVTYV